MTLEAVPPAFFRPKVNVELIRLGRDYDGGYLVDLRSVEISDTLIGLGLNEDWSFEEDFVARRDVPVYAFDPTVGAGILRGRVIDAMARPQRPRQIASSLRTLTSYKRFFAEKRKHIRKFVGKAGDPNSLNLTEVFELAKSDAAFLKIDIEGSEYRILDELVANSHRIAGMAIELHDIDLHLDRIERFVDAFPLPICHVHANNFSAPSDGGMPYVIECSFAVQSASGEWQGRLPHKLDQPNRADVAEIPITFA